MYKELNNFALYFIHFNDYLLLSVTIGCYRLLSAAIGKIARAVLGGKFFFLIFKNIVL